MMNTIIDLASMALGLAILIACLKYASSGYSDSNGPDSGGYGGE